MRILRRSFIFLFLALFSIFSFTNICFAGYTIVDEGSGNVGGNTSPGGGLDCYSASACWNPSVPTPLAGARITLVDHNGKIVAGTHSVDIKKSSDNSIHTSGVKIEYMSKKAALITWGTGSDITYDYKNGSNPYYTIASGEEQPITNYKLISIPIFFESSDTSKGNVHGNDRNGRMTYGYFSEVFTSQQQVYSYKDMGRNMDFLSLYLHLNGYMTDDEAFLYTDLMKTKPVKYRALREYTLIFEPIFVTYSNSVGMAFYGTGKDFVKAMHRNTDTWEIKIREGLGGWDQVKQFACALYTAKSTGITNLGEMNQDCYSMYSRGRNTGGYNSVQFYMSGDDVYFDKYGFGMASFYLAGIVPPPTYPEFGFSEKICNGNSANDTTFSFILSSNREYIDSNPAFFDLKKNGVKVFDPSDQGISCVDSVEYDFHDLIYGRKDEFGNETPGLSGEKEFNSTLPISVFPVKAKVKRFCASGTTMTNNIIQSDFTNVFSVNYANGDITFKAPTVKCSTITEFAVTEYSCELEYEPVNNTLTLQSNSYSAYKDGIENGKGMIKFTNKAFGKNNKLIETFVENGNSIWSGNENESAHYTLDSSGDSLTCNFEYSVEGCGDDCDPSLGNNNLRFRVIALDNPFPNRDGTSRLPGVNWLNKENYVYEYIVNNRGAVYESYLKGKKQAALDAFLGKTTSDDSTEKYSPEDMYYLVEPMYTVTLTPKTMRKIREYNKKYSYYSMYNIDYTESGAGANETVRQNDKNAKKINCNSNNRECYSTFLRDGEIIPKNDLEGVCVLEKDLSFLREQLNSATPVPSLSAIDKEVAKRVANPSYYRDKGDLNKNGRLDKWDVVVATYPERHTKFYTCANKTFLSGGPLEGDE